MGSVWTFARPHGPRGPSWRRGACRGRAKASRRRPARAKAAKDPHNWHPHKGVSRCAPCWKHSLVGDPSAIRGALPCMVAWPIYLALQAESGGQRTQALQFNNGAQSAFCAQRGSRGHEKPKLFRKPCSGPALVVSWCRRALRKVLAGRRPLKAA